MTKLYVLLQIKSDKNTVNTAFIKHVDQRSSSLYLNKQSTVTLNENVTVQTDKCAFITSKSLFFQKE